MNREPTFMPEPRTEELVPQLRVTRKRTPKATPARSAEPDDGLLTLLLGLEDETSEATSYNTLSENESGLPSVVETRLRGAEISEGNLAPSTDLEQRAPSIESLASPGNVPKQEQSQFPCQSPTLAVPLAAEQVSSPLSAAEREPAQLEVRGETYAVEHSHVAVSEAIAAQEQLEKLVAQLVGAESESEAQEEREELKDLEKLRELQEQLERRAHHEQAVQGEQESQAAPPTETAQDTQGEPATQAEQETARELQPDSSSNLSSAPSAVATSAAQDATPFVAPLQVTSAPRVLVDSFILPPTLGMMSVRGVVGQEVTVAQLQEQVTSQVVTATEMSAQLATSRSMPFPSVQSEPQPQQAAEDGSKKHQKAGSPTSSMTTNSTKTTNAELEFARLLGFNNLSKLFKVTPELRQWVNAWQEGKLPLPCVTPVEVRTRVQDEHVATTSSVVRSFIFPWEQILTSSKELQVLVVPWLADIDTPTFTQPQLMELELWYWIYQFTQQHFEQVLTPTRLEFLAHYLGLVRGVHALGTELDTSGGVWQALHQLREISVTQYQVKDAHLYRNLVRELQAVTPELVQERLHALRLRKQQLQQEQQVREQLATSQAPSPATRAGKENHRA